jgi:multiple sugar transport system substrate-binding protein
VNTTIQPLTPAQYKAWDDGSIASTIGAAWLQGIQTSSSAASAGKWAVAPLPEWTEGQPSGANYGGATTAVLSGTKHPYEDAVFAEWLSTNPAATSIVFAQGGTGASLAYSKTSALDLKVPYYGNQEIFHVFQDGANTTDTSFQWAPDQTNLNNYLQDALAGAFDGSSTIAKAYTAAQAKAAADLKSQSIPVTVK